jgi:hypothetical protein
MQPNVSHPLPRIVTTEQVVHVILDLHSARAACAWPDMPLARCRHA